MEKKNQFYKWVNVLEKGGNGKKVTPCEKRKQKLLATGNIIWLRR